MALPTQGFSVRSLPATPTIPSNVGTVQPLDPVRIAQLAMQLREQANNQSIQNQQAMNADNAARQGALLARAAESRNAETFQSQAPVRSLLAKQAGLEESRVGGEEVGTSTTALNPDGTYTITTKKTIAGQPVSSSTATSPFMSGKPTPTDLATAYLTPEEKRQGQLVKAGINPKAISAARPVIKMIQSADGSTHAFAADPNTGVLRPARIEDLDSGELSAPNDATITGPSLQNRADIKTQQGVDAFMGKSEAQKEQDFPIAKEKVVAADLALEDGQRAIKQALDFLSKNPNLITGYAQNVKIRGTPASQFDALLQPIKSSQFLGTLSGLRGTAGNTGIGRVLQSEVPFFVDRATSIDPVLNPETLAENLRYLAERAPRLRELSKDAFNEHYAKQLNQSTPKTSSKFPVINAEQAKTAPNGTYQTPDGRTITINR